MNIPDCYDPVCQAERLAAEQENENTCSCHLCRKTIYPGDTIHIAQFFVVCPSCFEELGENKEIFE